MEETDSLLKRNDEKRLEKEKRRHKVTLSFTITLCVIAAIALFVYIVNGIVNKVYNGYEVLDANPRQDSNSVQYKGYQGKILKYSRDGASGIQADGTILWNGSYEMNNPTANTCGEFVIIGDIGGKESYVYNGTNSGVLLKETLPISQIEVASQGVAAVVLEDSMANEIHIYDPFDSGNTLLFTIPTNVKEDGYPVDIALSPDGKKLVTSYLGINNGVMQTKIAFYNMGEVGKDKVNFIVGGIDMGQELCPSVVFINNDTICIYGEQSFQIYSMQELPEEVLKQSFDVPIKSSMYNEKYMGFILDNNMMIIYDTSGKKVLEQEISFEYEKVVFTENEIVFTADMSCIMMRFNGDIKWNYTFEKNVNYIFPAQKKDRYILIDDTNIEQVKLSKEKK